MALKNCINNTLKKSSKKFHRHTGHRGVRVPVAPRYNHVDVDDFCATTSSVYIIILFYVDLAQEINAHKQADFVYEG